MPTSTPSGVMNDPYLDVHVANDMDTLRLAYLLSVIRPEKLRKSIRAYTARYPGSKPFVSTLLKWCRIHVPTSVYAPALVPDYRVYVLVCQDKGRIKIGMSGQWRSRALAFSRQGDFCEFDPVLSVAVAFSDKASARRAEATLKRELLEDKVGPPEFVRYGSYGHHEWRAFASYAKAVERLRYFESTAARDVASWSFHDLAMPSLNLMHSAIDDVDVP